MSDTLQKQYAVSGPNVIRDSFDGEVVIVSMDTGAYYSLQGSAAAIWDLIEKKATFTDIVADLSTRFTATAAEIEATLTAFLVELQNERLIVEQSASSGNSTTVDAFLGERAAFVAPALAKFSDMQELLLLDPIHDVDETGWPARADGTTA